MNPTLRKISTIVAEANDLFDAGSRKIDTVLGVIDSALRKQGIKADAITVDCLPLDKKIVFLLHDDKPELVSIALGNKAGDIHSTNDYPVNEINVEMVQAILVENFAIA